VVPLLFPGSEIKCNERFARPIEQTNRQTMMPRQRHPLLQIRISGNEMRSLKPEPVEPMLLFTSNFGEGLPLELGDSANARNKVVILGIGNTPEKEAVELSHANGVDEVGV
jgi:hypothetical protein